MSVLDKTSPQDSLSRDTSDLFRLIFEQAAVGIAQIETATGRFIRINNKYCDIVGYTRSEMEHIDFKTITHHDDWSDDLESLRRLVNGDIHEFTKEKRYLRKNGDIVWVNITVSPLWAPGEPPNFHLAVVEDITARKHVEEALREQTAELTLLNALSQAVNSTITLEETIKKALTGVLDMVHPDWAFFFLCEEDRLVLKEMLPMSPMQFMGGRPEHKAGECLCGLALKELKPVYSQNIHADSRCTRTECQQAGFKSIAALPLVREKEAIGVIVLAAKTELDFSRKGRCLETLASQVTIALVNTQLYQAAQRELVERRRIEETLRESERKYRELVENANSIILRWNPQGEITFLNEFGQKFFGYQENEILGRNVMGTIVPETESTGRNLQSLMDMVCANPVEFEQNINENMLRDGCRVWIAWTNKTVFDSTGKLVEVLSIGTNITERKRAEEAAVQARRFLRDVLDTVPVRVFWKDLSGRYLGCNLPAAQDAGFGRPEEVVGKTDYEMLWRDSADIYRRDDLEVANSGQSKIGYEEPQVRPDGSQLWLRTSKIPLKDADGKIIGVLGTYEDITERKRKDLEREKLQAELMQAQKMESVGRLAGGVAHDFNNMLQVITGNANLAMDTISPDNPARESLEEIMKSAQRSADLTRQLLTFARKQTIQPKILNLNETVSGMLKMLGRLIGEDVYLTWRPGVNLWPVCVDPSQIDQILANLCVNARDAIGGHGKVIIETNNMTLDDTYATTHLDYVPGDYVLLAVSDTGKGMDAETRSHLFEPFFTTKEPGKGTGLGLATVFGIVKQNKGLISVYSELGKGSIFKIYLPRSESKAQVEIKTSEPSIQRGAETVLLVEDEGQILNLGLRILRQLGYHVLFAPTPESALMVASNFTGPIHLLITDVVMPEMNGKELSMLLKLNRPNIKCLFMSGYTADVIAHHGVLDEGVELLQKPFTVQTMAQKIRSVLNK